MNQDWKKVLLKRDATIKDAIEVLNREAQRIVLIVDDGHRLLGVVTDGDIRRGLLDKKNLESSVSEIMNTKPKIASESDSRLKILNVLKTYSLLQIPILRDGVVVGLETLQQLTERPKLENPIFIMAGGFGKRLAPLTDSCPKPLLKVGTKPILETIIEQFAEAGFYRIYISTHYLPEKIVEYFGDGSKWNVSIEYVHEQTPLGTGGALGLLPKNIPKLPIIMMNGDLLTKIDFGVLLKYHTNQNAIATMCVREYEYQVPYGVVEVSDNKISGMIEKPTHRYLVNAGIYVIDHEVLGSVGVNEKVDMPTLIERQFAKSLPVVAFPVHEYWLDIGKKHDFDKAQIDFFQN
jgi:dTDP-glucose pyrophosphorylase/predicted transcriptional regulator